MIQVLIVDDDKLARKGLISIMPWSVNDMKVVGEAANGAKALEFLKENDVDLLFVDLSMPVLSGIEFMQKARKIYPDIRFVVLTFHEEFEYVQKAIRLGAIDYISKVRLEMENFGTILSRIHNLIVGDSSQSSGIAQESTLRTAESQVESLDASIVDMKSLESDWLALYWLFNEATFERLCLLTERVDPLLSRLGGVIMRALSRAEAATGVEATTWLKSEQTQSALDWIRDYRNTIIEVAVRSNDLSQTWIRMIRTVIYIREQITTPLHAKGTAERFGMSRSYFSECFHKMVGCTFNDYIRQERTLMAKKLLRQEKGTVASIARAVGYGDVRYFSNVFHEQTGKLPSEYRVECAGGTTVL